ncbi:MAG: FKBP-type peptidyl-prolyl cis-trans isomerase [Candidatus Kariarchaeaceae archaeon]
MQNRYLVLVVFFLSFSISTASGYNTTVGIQENDEVNLHYILTYDNKVQQENPSFTTVVSNKGLIQGFYEGLLGMRVGQRENIVVGPEKGYPSGDLAGKTLYFDVKINSIVNNAYASDYVAPTTTIESLINFADFKVETNDESLFQEFISSPVVLAIAITGFVLIAYVRSTGSKKVKNVETKHVTPKMTAQEKLKKRREEVEKREY